MKLKILTICTAVAVCAACANVGQRQLSSTTPRAAEINAEMDSALIEQVDLQRLPAGAAVKAWAEASRAAHPRPLLLKYAIVYPTTFTERPVTEAKPRAKEPTVTVRAKNVTTKWLLNEICQQLDWYWVIREKTVLIGPREALPNPQP